MGATGELNSAPPAAEEAAAAADLKQQLAATEAQLGAVQAGSSEEANKAAELEGLVAELREKLSGAEGKLADALAELEALKAGHSEGESAQQEALEQQRKLYEELEQAV